MSNQSKIEQKTVFVFEDKEHQIQLSENLNMLRKNRQFCDVILQVGTKQDIHEVYAHKVVLSSSSPFFLEVFSQDQPGSNPASPGLLQYRMNGTQNAKLDFDPEAFEYIIDYAYTARLEIPKEKLREIYTIASKLKMNKVAIECGKFLLSTLTPENCLEIRNMKAVLQDPGLLQSLDSYIRANFEEIVQAKDSLNSELSHVQVEFLLNSEQEEQSVNDRNMFNAILDWIRLSFENENLHMELLREKLLMLYYNKALNEIHDCSDIDPHTPDELELIEDYRKMSKKLSTSLGTLNGENGTNGVSGGGIHHNQLMPSKPRQFLFTRSDSESSLSSDIAEEVAATDLPDWKFLANCRIGEHTLIGLVTITGQLCLITIKLRTWTLSGRKESSVDSDYCLIPPMSSPRCAVGTAELDGKLFVCGGYDRGECLRTVEIYDTVDNKWQTLASMQSPRGRFSITVVNGCVYAIGGCDGHNELDSAEYYNPLTMNWNSIPNSPVVRSNAGVCSMDSRIYVIGGWNGTRGLTRCDVYEPQAGQWSEIEKLHYGRYQTSVCSLNGAIYAVGGCDSWNCLTSVEAYINGQWRQMCPLQTARRGCGVATYEGKIYAVGGHDGVHALCSVEIYDPLKDEWTFGKPMTVARANVGAVVVGNKLYAVGGFNGKAFLNTIEYFDFDNNEWTTSVTIDKLSNGDLENGESSLDPLKPEPFVMNSKMKNPLSSETLVEKEETVIGH